MTFSTFQARAASRWWIGLLALALLCSTAAAVVAWVREARSRHELALQHEELVRLQEAAQQTERQLAQLQVHQDELERYRKQAEEVHRLRGQYQEWQRLKEEHSLLKSELARLRAQGGSSPTSPPAPSVAGRGSWIGISLATGPTATDVAVSSVAPGGPAANAGVQTGDLILAVDGRPVTTFQQVKELIRAKPAGQPVLLDLSRNGARTLIYVPTSPMPSFD